MRENCIATQNSISLSRFTVVNGYSTYDDMDIFSPSAYGEKEDLLLYFVNCDIILLVVLIFYYCIQVCRPDCRGQKPLPFSAGNESEISLTSKMCACVFAPRRYGIHQFIFYTPISFSCLHRRHTTQYYFSPFSHWLDATF